MYHAIVRRNLRKSFAEVDRGNYAAVVRQFAPGAEHWFSGGHALSGGRHGAEQIQRWYDRLAEVMPDLRFELKKVVAKGLPWDTVAFVEWVDHLTDREGNQYSNQGVHVVRIKWGRITELHVYCDTGLLEAVLERLGGQGVGEAVAEPVGEPGPFRAARAGGSGVVEPE
ncbi:nuclear transport factor 2 family protein [Kitasatospora sp. NPDC057692]|uniref:nuclear transport factor 2 family protein n=1 Tax=Kitasatospora sp. NPDC057692 TaxID=3346215 RepID=UPI00369BBA11